MAVACERVAPYAIPFQLMYRRTSDKRRTMSLEANIDIGRCSHRTCSISLCMRELISSNLVLIEMVADKILTAGDRNWTCLGKACGEVLNYDQVKFLRSHYVNLIFSTAQMSCS